MSQLGTELLLKLRAQFRNARVVETLKRVDVPEIGREVCFWPVRSLEERLAIERCVRLTGDRTIADLTSMHLQNVLHRARDEHGGRLFADEDEAALREIDPAVLERVSLAMGLGGPTQEDAEGN